MSIDRTKGSISVGRGVLGRDKILTYHDPAFIAEARYVTFSSWNQPVLYTGAGVQPL